GISEEPGPILCGLADSLACSDCLRSRLSDQPISTGAFCQIEIMVGLSNELRGGQGLVALSRNHSQADRDVEGLIVVHEWAHPDHFAEPVCDLDGPLKICFRPHNHELFAAVT